MSFRETLLAVLQGYSTAKLTSFAGNSLAALIRKEAALDLKDAAVEQDHAV
jgi:hypothetical protein